MLSFGVGLTVSSDPYHKRNVVRCRFILGFGAAIAGIYVFFDNVVWWYWAWMVFVGIVAYAYFIWLQKCPKCRAPFALEVYLPGSTVLTMKCKYCGEKCERVRGRR